MQAYDEDDVDVNSLRELLEQSKGFYQQEDDGFEQYEEEEEQKLSKRQMVVGQRKTVQLEGARAQPFDFDLEEEPIAHAEEAADEEEENFFEELA